MKLNPEQKLAVDTIDGPVMVVAGAGTGKTQTIALRIANILKKTQVNPGNILCLTFTDSAAVNMRDRLLSVIGPEAYSVRVGTFHSFCQSIIRANPEYFYQFNVALEPLDKIDQIQIIRQLIDQLPPDSALKNPVDTYFYQNAIISALESLKKENISPPTLDTLVKQAGDFLEIVKPFYDQLKNIRADKKNLEKVLDIVDQIVKSNINQIYKTKISSLIKDKLDNAKEVKAAIIGFYENTQNQYPKQQVLSLIYPLYQSALQAQHRFDFDDLILSVIDCLRSHPDLLSSYQEKFQYILVDEYQDTNSAQNEILNLLCQNQESPNIFVVGDDDQSIFRFQGASTENIYNFYLRYHPKLTVLKNNYRSHKLILDSSASIINRNLSRLSRQIKDVDKTLVATVSYDPDPINLYSAQSQLEENYWVVSQIQKLLRQNVKPKNIAVLFRNNADIDDLLPLLSSQKIKYVKNYGTDILLSSVITQLLDLLSYLDGPGNETLLQKILNYPFLHFSATALFKHLRQGDPLPKFDKFQAKVAIFQKKKATLSSQELFDWAVRKFGYLRWILKSGNLETLKFLDRLYSEFKKINDNNFSSIVNKLRVYQTDQIPLISPPLLSESDSCLNLMTIHKAKGLEFEHVFIIKTLASRWENSRGQNKINLPLGVLPADALIQSYDVELEENRRLFYVALTRAKKQIYLSFTQKTPEGREQPPSRFLSEIDPKCVEVVPRDSKTEESALLAQFKPAPTKLQSPEITDYLRHYFKYHYHLNVTHLNSYQKCPLCFFFKTILKIPQAKTKPLSFGTSVHGALAYLFNLLKEKQQLIPLDKLLSVFESNLKRENLSTADHNDLLFQGQKHLTDYYQHYQATFNSNCLVEHDFRPYLTRLDDIPITGKIDKIEIIKGKKVNVVDFKTGNPDSKYQELSKEGDYYRQLLFYKILSDHSPGFPYQVASGTIDFIQKSRTGKFIRRDFTFPREDIQKTENLIKNTYRQITSFNFSPSPDCPDPDHLHQLFNKYFK